MDCCDNVMIIIVSVLKIFQILIAIFLIVDVLKNRFSKLKEDNYYHLSLSNWLFYFGTIGSFILSFGVIAELESISESATENIIDSIDFIIMFLFCIVFCVAIAFTQKVWHIKYNENELTFRNSFGISKTYKNADVTILHRRRMTVLYINGKEITKWDNRLMNTEEDIFIERYYS